MEKRLEDMTLEELWKLFPITITAHNPHWKSWADEEIESLSKLLSNYPVKISHVGSTAIPDIQAKPIIDILVEVSNDYDWNTIKELLTHVGYICMSECGNRMSFNKGYTVDGYAERVYHVHIHLPGDNDEILFRDYLNAHADVAKEYEDLKLNLLPEYRNNRDGYTAAKSQFIQRVLSMCRNGETVLL